LRKRLILLVLFASGLPLHIFFPQPIGLKDFLVLFSPFSLLLL
jgi:hypothetical protein